MRDVQTDWLLLLLRRFFNESAWDKLTLHREIVSDWLEERGRLEEAQALRSPRWLLLITEGQGWPPPCVVVTDYLHGVGKSVYMESDWIGPAIAAEKQSQDAQAQDEGDPHGIAWTDRW
jgi:hypothetical protein